MKDITSTKRFLTSTIYNHISRFDKDLSYYNFNKALWSAGFDPKDPDNGWGVGYYKTVFPLKGTYSEIVPTGSIGYLLDHKCVSGHSDIHAYSNTLISDKKVGDKDVVNANVYCFVSGDFNGDMVCLRSDGNTSGNRVSRYDLDAKGIWQKLSISATCNDGNAPVSLYFNKLGVTSFSSLTGYVIFAYPQSEIISAKDTSLPGDTLSWKDQDETKSLKSHFTLSSDNQFLIINKKAIQKSKEREPIELHQNFQPLIQSSSAGPHCYPLISSFLGLAAFQLPSDSINVDTDVFRNWIKNIFSEDTSYTETKTRLKVDTLSRFFLDDRLSRWQFAIQIYKNEYNWPQKIFGGGFAFLNWYGYHFMKDKTQTDYPHNPLLYILLYSGIIGLTIYLIFLYKTFYYYIKYINEYLVFFVFFLITFYFTFFSGGNPFDPPAMGFFAILPYFIHSVYKKDSIESQNIRT